MRDHLLGCQAFLPPEPEKHCNVQRAKPFALGIPQRAKDQGLAYHRKLHAQEQAIDAFNTGDHTPPEMQADFPREYDLMTMLNEAAGRAPKMHVDFAVPYGDGAVIAGFVPSAVRAVYQSDIEDLAKLYDRELQRLCGLSPNLNGAEFGAVVRTRVKVAEIDECFADIFKHK